MKKAILLLAVMIVLFTGCGKGTEGKNDNTGDNLGSPEPTSIPADEVNTDDNAPEASPEPSLEPSPDGTDIIDNPSPLTGLELEGPYQPIAVMVENLAAARPHSGVIDADLVYEAHVEGGITRFLAIFLSRSPKVVGPVRSLRHYYMWMGLEWDVLLVHNGQSFIAEDRFDEIPVKRVNGLKTGKPFWRDNSRKTPHNLYTSIESLREYVDFEQKAEGFDFTSSVAWDGEEYRSIEIPYNKVNNIVTYKYDPDTRLNYRYINGEADVDRETGKQISARNIIIQYADHSMLEPGAGYRDVAMIGKGRAQFFAEGRFAEGTWERASQEDRTIFYDSGKNEISLVRGNTWVQVVQNSMEVSID